jgi:hypothetical protein
MDEKAFFERKIFLKRQTIEILQKEIAELEANLRNLEKSAELEDARI